MADASSSSDSEEEIPRDAPRRRTSTLGLASRHALDATRVDDSGRKALHRFAGSCDISAEHLQRVVEVHPEAASHVDHRGWLPLNHYCRGLSGDYDDVDDEDLDRHLGTLGELPARFVFGDHGGGKDRPGDPKFFEACACMEDVRKEYKVMLLKYHPDKNIGNEAEACRQMQRLQDAYQIAKKKFHKKKPLEAAVAAGDVEQVLRACAATDGEDIRDFADAEGNTLLHLVCRACSRNMSGPQLAAVVRLHPPALREQNQEGDTPLHCLCANHRSPMELEALVRVMLGEWRTAGLGEADAPAETPDAAPAEEGAAAEDSDADADAAARPNSDGRLPAHLLCRCQRFAGRKSVGALEALFGAFPDAAKHADSFAWTPLHLFAQFQIDPSNEGLGVVLGHHPAAAGLRTLVDEDTPLHLMCYAHRRKITDHAAEALGTLASFAPAAALQACKQGRLPWDHLPPEDPNYGSACGAMLGAVVSGLEAVCLDEDDEVAVREKLEEAVLEFRDARNGTLLHVVAGLQGADLAEDAALAVFRVLETKAGVPDDDGATPLHRLAAAPRDGGLLARLVDASPESLVAADAGGRRPLHCACACEEPHLETVRALIAASPKGAEAFTEDESASTAAHLACAACPREIGAATPELLKSLARAAPRAASAADGRGKRAWDYLPRHDDLFDDCFHALLGELVETPEVLDDEGEGDGGTVLHLVCAHHRASITRVLSRRPDDAKRADRAGNTPLHHFVQNQELSGGSPEELDALLHAFPDAAGCANRAGLTPLHVLVASQKQPPADDVVQALVKAAKAAGTGARALGAGNSGDTPAGLLCRANGKNIDARVPELLVRLVAAARDVGGDEAAAALFAVDERGARPWDHLKPDDERFPECAAVGLREVLREPASRSSLEHLDRKKRVPLHLLCSRHGAALRGDAEFAEAFFSPEAALAVDETGATPLHCLCRDAAFETPGDVAFLRRLLSGIAGEAASAQNKSGWAPLHHLVHKNASGAAEEDSAAWSALEALVEAWPAAVGLTTSAGDSPLHLAANAYRKVIAPGGPRLLDTLVAAAPDAAARMSKARGKARKTPLEWLPRDDDRYVACEEILAHKAARCLELLLEHHAEGARHALPQTGELALHQLCAARPPVATVRMLDALLAAHPEAANRPRKPDLRTCLAVWGV